MSEADPLILTLTLDPPSFAFFEERRRRYFPAERNLIPAHLTLFHALPGAEIGTIRRDLAVVCASQGPIRLEVTGLRFIGRGVAYGLASHELASLRRGLAARWAAWLGPQDRQKHSPHVTVQNKVAPDDARALFAGLSASFAPFTGRGEGLDLWWYRGGPWESAGRFPFRTRSSVG